MNRRTEELLEKDEELKEMFKTLFTSDHMLWYIKEVMILSLNTIDRDDDRLYLALHRIIIDVLQKDKMMSTKPVGRC